MRLRNKKTGEIADKSLFINYNSLSELNEEWEDYEPEEPKEYWYIDWTPEIGAYHTRDVDSDADERQKEIGNYFETKEEADKAVEKLKAWKRLKDKGFKFDGYDSGHNSNKDLCGQAYFKVGNFWFDIKTDLNLLFGGEE